MTLEKEKGQAAIGLKVPIEAWELWVRLPREKKSFVKSIFLALLVGVSKMEFNPGTGEVILKADPELLEVLREALGIREGDACREAVRRFYEKLLRDEIGLERYNAPHILKVWLRPCFED